MSNSDTAEWLTPERQREIVEAWQRSDFDIAPCRMCGESVVCIPDGLPFLESKCKTWWPT